jgi:predicted RNA-binding Zn ribbon-like protein
VDFDHYKAEGARLAADLVNSLATPSETEHIGDAGALASFLEAHHVAVPGEISARDVDEVHALRSRIRAVFEAADEAGTARLVNDLLTESATTPQMARHNGGRWHMHYWSVKGSIADRLAAIAAMGLAAVMCEFGRERFGVCAADDCGDVFVDTSKNRSRRFCNDTCSTRTNVAAHRARRKQRA